MEEERVLKNIMLEWNKAIEDNDVNEIARYMSDDWIIVGTEGGIIKRSDFLGWVESGDLSHTRMDFEVVMTRVYNNCAVVICKGTSAGVWEGNKFEFYEWASDTYIKKDGKWQCVLTMVTPAKNGNQL